MPALETFDWLKDELWPQADEDLRKFLDQQRSYLLTIRNENERRRFIDEVMLEARSFLRQRKL